MISYKNSHYFVTTEGNIINTKTGRILKPRLIKNNYGKVVMYINGHKIEKLIHRLVAEIYLPNPNSFTEVNHIDNNPLNNKLDNLEWCTPQMNRDHTVSQKRQAYGIRSASNKLTENEVLEIRKLIEMKEKITYIARKFNVSYQNIQSIRDGINWKHLKGK